jgi:hypothetical protein
MSGVSTRDLMARMGHDSVRAAIIYQHATTEADARIAAALEVALAGDEAGASAGSRHTLGARAGECPEQDRNEPERHRQARPDHAVAGPRPAVGKQKERHPGDDCRDADADHNGGSGREAVVPAEGSPADNDCGKADEGGDGRADPATGNRDGHDGLREKRRSGSHAGEPKSGI